MNKRRIIWKGVRIFTINKITDYVQKFFTHHDAFFAN